MQSQYNTKVVSASSAALMRVLEGLPVNVKERGDVVISKEIEFKEMLQVGDLLIEHGKHSTAIGRLALGDWWNALTDRWGGKKEIIQPLIDKHGEKVYTLFRQYGWVARKWPVHLRSPENTWSFYRDFKPDGSKDKKVKRDRMYEVFAFAWDLSQRSVGLSVDEGYQHFKEQGAASGVAEESEAYETTAG